MNSLSKVIVFFAVLGVVGAGLLLFPQSPLNYKTLLIVKENAEPSSMEEQKEMDKSLDVSDTSDVEEDMVEESSSTDETQSLAEELQEDFIEETTLVQNVEVTDRTLGDVNAPVKMIEFSSLSCGHCGDFHRETYPQFKKEYVETGKVHLTMIDFPLNLPALHGAMIAHCLPEDQYFNFLQLLFTTQSNWLSGDYEAKLKQNAQLAGLSSSEVEDCLSNKELEDKLITRMEDNQKKWDVSSTPSFIIQYGDETETVVGNREYADFKIILEDALK